METILTKCFICDVACVALEKYLGINVARNITLPIKTILTKCLRETVESEKEYFCAECAKKIEEYDQIIQLSLQIETELYELYHKKMNESCYLLDAEIIIGANGTNDPINLENKISHDELNDSTTHPDEEDEIDNNHYDDMVVEYLYECEPHENDSEYNAEQKTFFKPETGMNRAHKIIIDKTLNRLDDSDSVGNGKSSKKVKQKKASLKPLSDKKKKLPVRKVQDKQTSDFTHKTDGFANHKKCDFIAKDYDEIQQHEDTHKDDEGERVACDICGRSYKSKSALSIHIGIHSGKSPHECHICGKQFTQRGALVRHMPIHTGEKPHQCDVCGKRFMHYSSFHMHQMVHTNERKKKCEVCGLELRSNSHMTRHMRVHTGEKPFACPICGQKFAQRYNMKTHYNTHQGIHRIQSKNHKCLLCTEAFNRRERLNKHFNQVHGLSHEDINIITENGPNNEKTQKLIEEIKQNASYIKEEVYVEYIDDVASEYVDDDS